MAADERNPTEQKPDSVTEQQKAPTEPNKAAVLGEDDEFEDFPSDDWPEEQTEAAQGSGQAKHLWEESWDDDDTSDDFSTQLRDELKKVEASKRRT
ncbi:26 proteasome complex subunit DSS1 [Ophiocordyceps camponoti-floridani]|uniref:26S proteasome complex subunit SEM1 n=1 Tax=Ophiocordyceps camponoti-floridani TaxID=2030778 RepID=A0A8H4VDN2_9HYPO|nr:26 proteasome complex subunit DSS1 [Ophiocordyceps camponoti-floridani]